MYTLAMETSCDDTSVAILRGDREVLCNLIASQIPVHQEFGGVVPEIASRKHLEAINPLIALALQEAGCTYEQLSLICVTRGPGLIGSLLVGVSAAKALAFAHQLPIVGVNHMQGHVCANYLSHPDLQPPFLCLVISGGHTYLCDVKTQTEYDVLSSTRDDAVGESFDKVARVLGYSYPGGPAIEKAAREGNADAFAFPQALSGQLDFSFSGLKTAVINTVHQLEQKGQAVPRADIAASFQRTIIQTLVEKTMMALEQTGYSTLCISGGVACNGALRQAMQEVCAKRHVRFCAPDPVYCTDNAAMIAAAGIRQFHAFGADSLEFETVANLELDENPKG